MTCRSSTPGRLFQSTGRVWATHLPAPGSPSTLHVLFITPLLAPLSGVPLFRFRHGAHLSAEEVADLPPLSSASILCRTFSRAFPKSPRVRDLQVAQALPPRSAYAALPPKGSRVRSPPANHLLHPPCAGQSTRGCDEVSGRWRTAKRYLASGPPSALFLKHAYGRGKNAHTKVRMRLVQYGNNGFEVKIRFHHFESLKNVNFREFYHFIYSNLMNILFVGHLSAARACI